MDYRTSFQFVPIAATAFVGPIMGDCDIGNTWQDSLDGRHMHKVRYTEQRTKRTTKEQ